MASSWPTIIRRSPVSSDCASLPVFPGSSGILSRSILSTAFLVLREAICLGSPCHKLLRNPSSIPLDAPGPLRILPRFLSLRPAFRFRWSNFDTADQGSHRHLQEHPYNFGNVLGPNFPI